MGKDWSLVATVKTEGPYAEQWKDAAFKFSAVALEYSPERYLRTFLATGDPRSKERCQEYKLMRMRAIDVQDLSKSHALTAASSRFASQTVCPNDEEGQRRCESEIRGAPLKAVCLLQRHCFVGEAPR